MQSNKPYLIQETHSFNKFRSGFIYHKLTPLFCDSEGLGIGVINDNLRGIKWLKQYFQFIHTFKIPKSLADSYSIKSNNSRYILDRIIFMAVEKNASDIHFFIRKNKVEVYVRSPEGLLFLEGLSLLQYERVLRVIKFESHLDQSIIKEPQQSSFSADTLYKDLFIRVSILPTLYGQDSVLRLAFKTTQFSSLESLGFSKNKVCILKQMINEKSGIVLVTGSTGSGKTTTLYGLVKEILSHQQKVVVSLEDPIECEIEGLRQSQVDLYGHYTYAKGLKALLRQDPDVILLGEIRDKETAAIAFQAAFTGHLVISSCHTSDVFSTLTRLYQLGVDSSYIQGALKGVISQKLIPVNQGLKLESEVAYFKKGIQLGSLNSKELLIKNSVYFGTN